MEYYDEVVEIKSRPKPQPSTGAQMATSSASSNKMRGAEDDYTEQDRQHDPEEDSMPAFQKIETKPKPKKMPTALTDESNEGSETEESSGDSDLNNRQQPLMIDHKEWDQLDVSPDIKEIFQYIMRYSPAKVSIDYVLQPFIPEFIPAVGDIDAFLKVVPPKLPTERKGISDFIAKLGVDTLDEPSGQQSEPALLHMKLRSLSTTVRQGPDSGGGSRMGTGASGAKMPIVSTAKSSKDVERWIAEIQNMHVNQPFPMIVHRRKPLQDIDALMNEWPPELERTLNTMGFPNAYLDCSLEFYIRLICSFLDIVIPSTDSQSDYILALYTLFNLFLAVKNPII